MNGSVASAADIGRPLKELLERRKLNASSRWTIPDENRVLSEFVATGIALCETKDAEISPDVAHCFSQDMVYRLGWKLGSDFRSLDHKLESCPDILSFEEEYQEHFILTLDTDFAVVTWTAITNIVVPQTQDGRLGDNKLKLMSLDLVAERGKITAQLQSKPVLLAHLKKSQEWRKWDKIFLRPQTLRI